MKNLMKKLAGLADYLDGRGHKEESYLLDHALHSMAQDEPPSWWSPVDRTRWEIEHAGDVKQQEREDQIDSQSQPPVPPPHHEPETTQAPGQDKAAPKQNFVMVELAGFEPIKVTKLSQVTKLSKNPKVSQEALAISIYNSIYPGSGPASIKAGKTLKDAVTSGINAKVLEDDRSFWER